jgi:hypothetical protein
MPQIAIPELQNASFFDFVRTRIFSSNPSAIVDSYWSPFTATLYLAVREQDGFVTARVYEDRGLQSRRKDGPRLQKIGVTSEDEGPVHIHCPPEFLIGLSPARTKKAHIWRECCIRWFKHYRVLLEATANVTAGGHIRLFPPGASQPRFTGRMNPYGGIAGDDWPDTLALVHALSSGYLIVVEPTSSREVAR